MAGKKKLGTGLEAIFGEDLTNAIDAIQTDAKINGGAQELDINKVLPNPYQPRREFEQKALEELSQSIAEHGVFTPVLVKSMDSNYVLIAGERRLRAAKMAGLATIPAIVKEFTDAQMMEISLMENIQREDLSVIEEAISYDKLIHALGYKQEELANRIGKSREHVSNILRLLKLPKEVQDMVTNKELSMGQVRPLITLGSKEDMLEMAYKIQQEDLSARQVEQIIRNSKKEKTSKVKPMDNNSLKNVEQIIQKKLQTKVTVTDTEIRIKYSDVNDLNRILEVLDCLDD